jgi:hypothetical protein
MTDYAEMLTDIDRAQTQAYWLAVDGQFGKAKEKAILIEQSARALITCLNRHIAELERIAAKHSNAQVLTKPKQIYAHIYGDVES